MNIGYTIVTNSYLAHAKGLRDSFLKHNPDFSFFIGLLDTPLEDENMECIVCVSDLGIGYLDEMHQKYNIFELSCAMKPFFAEYFLTQKKAEIVMYFDADILVFGDFKYLKNLKKGYSIFLTPHNLSFDKNIDTQKNVLVSGIYNGGFFAVTNQQESFVFLDWWKKMLTDFCFDDTRFGLFVDQLWLNHVPVLFEKTYIIKHLGYNVAYWNIQEREISQENGGFKINKNEDLVFYHFSGYEPNNKLTLSKYANPNTNFEHYPQTKPFFSAYNQSLKVHNFDFYKNIKSVFGTNHLNTAQMEIQKQEQATENRIKDELERQKNKFEQAIQQEEQRKIQEEQRKIQEYEARKNKSYLSVLWKALKGEIIIKKI